MGLMKTIIRSTSCKKEANIYNKRIGNVLIIACTIISFSILSLLKAHYSPITFVAVQAPGPDQILAPSTKFDDVDEDEDESAIAMPANITSNPTCFESSERSDTCEAQGDVRVVGNTTRTIFVNPSGPREWKIKPYARKGNPGALVHVQEWSLVPFSGSRAPPPECTKNHTDPAVLFSIGGYTGNFFHDVTDVLVPLFVTSHKFKKRVHLLVSDTKPWWVNKYAVFFRHLSDHDVIDTVADNDTHCFPNVIVGPVFHKELGVDAAKSPEHTMEDFKALARKAYGLERETVSSGIPYRPRLLVVSRSRTRVILNEKEVVEMAIGLGFEVVAEEPGISTDVAKFARMVNSVDVMVGVHGAGLTHMVFLPSGAVVVQVVPFGGLERVSRDCFKNPAVGMGLKYLDYVIGIEETSLVQDYSRDDPVLKDPASVRNKGWNTLSAVYLKQNVRPHIDKLRITLLEALKNLNQS